MTCMHAAVHGLCTIVAFIASVVHVLLKYYNAWVMSMCVAKQLCAFCMLDIVP